MVLQGFYLCVLVGLRQLQIVVVLVFFELNFELFVELVRLVDFELIVLDLFVEIAFHLRKQLLLPLLLIAGLDAFFSLGNFATAPARDIAESDRWRIVARCVDHGDLLGEVGVSGGCKRVFFLVRDYVSLLDCLGPGGGLGCRDGKFDGRLRVWALEQLLREFRALLALDVVR